MYIHIHIYIYILESSGALRAPSILLCAVIHFASARTIPRLSPSIDTFSLMHQCLDCVRSTCKKCQEMEIAFPIYNGPLSKSGAPPLIYFEQRCCMSSSAADAGTLLQHPVWNVRELDGTQIVSQTVGRGTERSRCLGREQDFASVNPKYENQKLALATSFM